MAYWNNKLLVSETTYVSDQTICGTYGGDVFDYTSESPLAVIGGYSIKEVMATVRASTLRPRWRISILSSDDRVLRYIPEEDILAGGSYSENYQSGQRRSLSFSVLDEDGKYSVGVNGVWFMSRFGLEMGIGMPDGGVAWVKRGVYIAQQPSQQHSADRNVVQVACADKWALFSGASGRLESTYEIESGSKIIPIIKSIQSTDRESGVPFDVQPLIVHPSLMDAITQSKVTMNPGQTYADMLLELATQMSAEIINNLGRVYRQEISYAKKQEGVNHQGIVLPTSRDKRQDTCIKGNCRCSRNCKEGANGQRRNDDKHLCVHFGNRVNHSLRIITTSKRHSDNTGQGQAYATNAKT